MRYVSRKPAPAAYDAPSGSGNVQSVSTDDAFGVSAAARARERQHATAVEVARDLGAGNERQVRHLGIQAVADQQVGEVHAGGAHVDDRVALRLGNLLDGQVAADLAEDGRPHRSSLCDQRGTSSP